jgi:hypothetical protein
LVLWFLNIGGTFELLSPLFGLLGCELGEEWNGLSQTFRVLSQQKEVV